MRKRQGNLNNIRVCNGKFSQVLANVSGVLAVQCFENNGGLISHSAGHLSFNITVQISNHISSRDSTDPNGGITTLVEVSNGNGANLTVKEQAETIVVGVPGVQSNTVISVYD